MLCLIDNIFMYDAISSKVVGIGGQKFPESEELWKEIYFGVSSPILLALSNPEASVKTSALVQVKGIGGL